MLFKRGHNSQKSLIKLFHGWLPNKELSLLRDSCTLMTEGIISPGSLFVCVCVCLCVCVCVCVCARILAHFGLNFRCTFLLPCVARTKLPYRDMTCTASVYICFSASSWLRIVLGLSHFLRWKNDGFPAVSMCEWEIKSESKKKMIFFLFFILATRSPELFLICLCWVEVVIQGS